MSNFKTTADPAPRRRILIVDDNPSIHDDFRKTLCRSHARAELDAEEEALFGVSNAPVSSGSAFAFELDSAFQGQEALAKVEQAKQEGQPYQMAFMDMRMPPGWDGVQTIERIWQFDPDIQIVICSAFSDYSWEEITRRLDPGDRLLILKKPFDEAEVSQLAATMTEKWALARKAQLKLAEMEAIIADRTEQLRLEALRDRLTGLPNRELLNDRISQAIRRQKRDSNCHFAVLFLDFDRFKVVNDSLGHAVGDKMLIAIADRLMKLVRELDMVAMAPSPATAARLGGDEFVVLLENLRENHDAAHIAERLLLALAEPFHVGEHTLQTSVSIGITTSAIAYATPDQPIRDADTAMYRAKATGKNRYVLFDSNMHAVAMDRLTLENDLRSALGSSALFLNYQPIINLRSGAISGFEALLRWKHASRGMVSPADFIPLAEELGIIVPLGAWVLEEACKQIVAWRKQFPSLAHLTMSVNLSRRQLVGRDIVSEIQEILARTGASASCIKLEITESTMMVDAGRSIAILEQIRQLGIGLHIDDFGTGYSSLSCLHKFPISGLKIDRAFVMHCSERRDYAAIVNAIVTIAHHLRTELVAEGVEDQAQATLLKSMGCDQAQGYFFGRPMAADAAADYLRKALTPAVAA